MSHNTITIALLGLILAGCQSIPLFPSQSDASGTDSVKPNMITPLVEKRESIMATGYAVISIQNHKNPSQQRLLAIRASKLDAYRALTEQVYGQHLDATTTVADMTIMNDTFRAKVEGVIYGATLVSITPWATTPTKPPCPSTVMLCKICASCSWAKWLHEAVDHARACITSTRFGIGPGGCFAGHASACTKLKPQQIGTCSASTADGARAFGCHSAKFGGRLFANAHPRHDHLLGRPTG